MSLCWVSHFLNSKCSYAEFPIFCYTECPYGALCWVSQFFVILNNLMLSVYMSLCWVSLCCVSYFCYTGCSYTECLIFWYTECPYVDCLIFCFTECPFAECRYAECPYAECPNAECRYTVYRGVVKGLIADARRKKPFSRWLTLFGRRRKIQFFHLKRSKIFMFTKCGSHGQIL